MFLVDRVATDDDSFVGFQRQGIGNSNRLETDTCVLRVRIVHGGRASGRLRHGSCLVDDLRWSGVSFIPGTPCYYITLTLTLSHHINRYRSLPAMEIMVL